MTEHNSGKGAETTALLDEMEAWDILDELVAAGARVSVQNRAVGPWACHIVRFTKAGERVVYETGASRAEAMRKAIAKVPHA